MKVKRLHKRAPIKEELLYIHEDFVFKAQALNISLGGVLLDTMPIIPDLECVPIMLSLPQVPIFQELIKNKTLGMNSLNFPQRLLRLRVKIVRKFEHVSEVDKAFISQIGCKIISITGEQKFIINEYVSRAEKNITFLLNQFEIDGMSKDRDKNRLVAHLAALIGHNKEESMTAVRNQLLYDYQSLGD